MGFGRKTHWLLGVGVAAGLMAGLAIGRRGRMQRMPRLDAWQRALAEQWGEARAAMLASCVLTKYQALYVRRPHFARRVLQSHLERNILPVGQPTITRTDTWFEGGIVWYRNQIIKRRFKQCPLASGSV